MSAHNPRHRQETGRSTRLGYIDFIRVICIFFIIIGHVWAEIPLTVFVYMFMLLSGYLWKDGRELVDDAKKKFKVLVYPYIGWGIPLLAVLIIQLVFFAEISNRGILTTIASVLWGGEKAKAPFTSFWYFTAIWFSGIFYRILTLWGRLATIVGTVVALIAASYWGEILANLPLGIGVAFCSIVFYAAGHGLQILQRKHRIPMVLSGVTLAGSIYSIAIGLVEPMVLKSGDFGTPFVSIAVYTVLGLAWIDLSRYVYQPLDVFLQKPIAWFVAVATPVILLHPIPIWFWYNVGWTGKSMEDKVPLFLICIIFATSLAVVAKNMFPPRLKKFLVP